MEQRQDARPRASAKLISSAMMGFVATFLFVAFLYNDLSSLAGSTAEGQGAARALRYAAAMAFGGAAAGFLLSWMFGRRGLGGWILAFLGGTSATVVAGLIGSLVGLLPVVVADGWQTTDLISIASGALILPFALNDWPAMAALWPALIFATHIWVRGVR